MQHCQTLTPSLFFSVSRSIRACYAAARAELRGTAGQELRGGVLDVGAAAAVQGEEEGARAGLCGAGGDRVRQEAQAQPACPPDLRQLRQRECGCAGREL
eukprot:1471046-Rhodomonas_salina.1